MATTTAARHHKIEHAAAQCRLSAESLARWAQDMVHEKERNYVLDQAKQFEYYANEITAALASKDSNWLRAALRWSYRAGIPFMVGSASLAGGAIAIADQLTDEVPEFVVTCISETMSAAENALEDLSSERASEDPNGDPSDRATEETIDSLEPLRDFIAYEFFAVEGDFVAGTGEYGGDSRYYIEGAAMFMGPSGQIGTLHILSESDTDDDLQWGDTRFLPPSDAVLPIVNSAGDEVAEIVVGGHGREVLDFLER